MRVLLVSTNREKLPQPVIPIGVCYVASALERGGVSTKVLDLCFSRDPMNALAKAISCFDPDCIGLSIRNLDNSDYQSPRFYLTEVRPLVQAVKKFTASPVFIGGSAVSIDPWRALDYLGCNVAVAGEGEIAATSIVEALSRGALPRSEGAEFRADGKLVVRAKARSVGTLSEAPPRIHRWLNLSGYRRYRVPLPVQSKRGCAFKCTYCTYGRIEGSAYRLRPAEQVVDEIVEMVRDTDDRFFEFVDSAFNHPVDHAMAICEAVIGRGCQVQLQASINPAGCTRELLMMMKRAGFNNLVCTPDSASDAMLNNLGKGFSSRDLAEVVEAVHAADLPVLWCFLFGGPGETEMTVRETLGFVESKLNKRDVAFLAAGIRVYAGTPLVEIATREGLIDPAGDLLHPTFYFSPSLPPERLAELIRDHLTKRQSYMLSSDLRWGFLLSMQRIASLLRLKTPLWRYAPLVNRLLPRTWSTRDSRDIGQPRDRDGAVG
mgnify:FL=1